MSDTIYGEYFQIAKDASQKYGEKTILLMQVGAFLEIYGTTPRSHSPAYKHKIFDICQVCDLNISEKKTTHEGEQLYMAGFRDFTSEKYIQKMVAANYTVVVYVQEKNERNTKRVFHSVYSPGTYLPFEADASVQLTNNIMCIWIDVYAALFSSRKLSATAAAVAAENGGSNIIYGAAVSNIYTGKSAMFEHQTQFAMNVSTFDELERMTSVYSPSEVILISSLDASQIEQIVAFAGIKTQSIHYVHSVDDVRAHNCAKQTYIHTILANQFGEDTFHICAEFSQYPVATQAYCFLLHFVKEHNPNLVRNISLPLFENVSTRTVLANHTLKQLNIINDLSVDGASSGHLSSVASLLNKCCSAIGRRRFYSSIVSPTFDEAWLNAEYDIMEHMLRPEHYDTIPHLRKQIGALCDLEKAGRQLISRRIYPNLIYKIHKSVDLVKQIHTCLYENKRALRYLCADLGAAEGEEYAFMDNAMTATLNIIETHLYVENCALYNSLSGFDDPIIREGISPKLDEYVAKKNEDAAMIGAIQKSLNDIVSSKMRGGGDANCDYVKIHETEKSNMTLQITKTRCKILKQYLDDCVKANPHSAIIINPKVQIKMSEITFKSLNASTDEIRIGVFTTLSSNLFELKSKINETIVHEYSKFLEVFEMMCFTHLENVSKYVAKLDILQSKVFVAREYNYCRPTIAATPSTGEGETAQKSFVNAKGLRHCLIEQLLTNEIYITNDVQLGAEGAPDGILLFGTNAVGKTSIIRALGIAVVLAQCGMFVPCSEFVYRPYSALFSRILGNDNIFKGLSTFAVEMNELRMILNMADNNSLILGDELCSGTENESALSIFMAGLMDMSAKRSSFIFATHFHEIVRFDEMRELDRVSLKHMVVYYDRERDCLVYDRKLKDGAGNKMYGLEVCKSLHLPNAFLERAYAIRTKYFSEAKGELDYVPSKYNAAKLKGMCEKCHLNMGEEVHHIQEQHLADENGFIGHFHKNHSANLMVLCDKCHKEIHNARTGQSQYISSSMSISSLSSNSEPEYSPQPVAASAPPNKRKYKKKTSSGKMIL